MVQRLPIWHQITLLVTAAVLLAAGALILITFRGPPPRAAPLPVLEIINALEGGRPVSRRFDVIQSPVAPQPRASERRDRRFEHMLALRMGTGQDHVRVYLAEPQFGGPPQRDEVRGDVTIGYRTDRGWRIVRSRYDDTVRHWQVVTAVSVLTVLALIIGCAWLLSRSITRPIEALARNARAAQGGQQQLSATPIDGPPEIRSLGSSLADLHARHVDHVTQRTTMFAAIAHDLGTPLMRLAFRVEALQDPSREAALADIILMRSLLADTLTMARTPTEPMEPVDLSAVVDAVVADCRLLGGRIIWAGVDSPALRISGAPVALRRMIQNILDNALRYAGNAVVELDREADHAVLRIFDDGPGFPADALPMICEPFVRGEKSRNQTTGGSGLGLAIVRTIVDYHHGMLHIQNTPPAGAMITVRLPRLPGS